MASEFYNKLRGEVEDRRKLFSAEQEEMRELANLYEGKIPDMYSEFFPENTPVHVVNYIRLAWDDLAQSVARQPEIQVDAKDSQDLNVRRAAKLKKIVTGYLKNSRPFEGAYLFALAWYLVGLGQAVTVVVPDAEKQAPRFEARDPRTAFPGIKRQIGNYIDELNDCIFVHEYKYQDAVKFGFAEIVKEGNAPKTCEVYEYVDGTTWAMVGPHGQKVAQHNLGRVPVRFIQNFAPNKLGMSQFSEQISLMVAVSRIITQKMAYIDRVIYPVTWVKGQEREIRLGPNAVNVLSENGEIGQLNPPAQLQVDRDLANLEKYQRILNRNTEVRQGEVNGKGAYVGAKTLDALNDTIDNSVQRFWEPMQAGLEYIIALALQMDEDIIGGSNKPIYAIAGDSDIVETYTPEKDIRGRRVVRVAYGFGVGGSYEAFLETIQSYQGGLTPLRRAVEQMPGVNDPNRWLRELELDKLDNIAWMAFEAQAASLDIVLWAKMRKKMESDGLSWHEAVTEYEEIIRQQSEQAAVAPVPEGAMTTPSPPQAPEQEALPGLPVEALVA